MTRADCRTLRSAAILLAEWAADVRSSCMNQATRELEDPRAQATYAKHMAVVKRLRQIANAEQAKLPKRGLVYGGYQSERMPPKS